jgi:predicted AAA+ superfamily ATPase
MGHKISKGFVAACVDWFEDAYFLFSVKIFSQSVAIQNVNAKKVYCIDHAMIKSVASGISANSGHLLENIIFMHLRRMTENLYYYRTSNGKEIDFIWLDSQKKKHLVQVCFSLADPLTQKREIASLDRAMDELSLTQATIVTLDENQQIEKGGKNIRIIPAWRYLIFNNSEFVPPSPRI